MPDRRSIVPELDRVWRLLVLACAAPTCRSKMIRREPVHFPCRAAPGLPPPHPSKGAAVAEPPANTGLPSWRAPKLSIYRGLIVEWSIGDPLASSRKHLHAQGV